MIISNLKNSHKYNSFHPLFKKAFDFLKTLKCEEVVDVCGSEIIGKQMFLNANRIITELKPFNQKWKMETHKKYIDIQYILKGENHMGWSPIEEVRGFSEGYNDLKLDLSGDCEFYETTPNTWFKTSPGTIVIFYPEDAHAPLNGEGEIVKIVLKVEV
jgi:biofilm protein TabA